MPPEKRDRIERLDELFGFLHQSVISAKNIARLKTLSGHEDRQVAEHATLIMEIARVFPGKRNRWLKLARHHRPLFERAVGLFGVEFFEDLLPSNLVSAVLPSHDERAEANHSDPW
jgi:hypothetical protein